MYCYTKPVLRHVRTWIFWVNVVNLGEHCECEFHNMAPWQALLNPGLAWMSNKQRELTEALQQFVFLLGSSTALLFSFLLRAKNLRMKARHEHV